MKSFVNGRLGGHWLLRFLAVQILVWTLAAAIAHGWSTIHHDMAEAFMWGQEWQWGYYKHPPVSAWVAGAWFQILPRANWSYFLLAAMNAAAGLAGAYALARRLAPAPTAKAATLLLALTPFFTFLAQKYNANTILLSLWPWTAYFFVRSLEDRSALMGILFGLLAALAMLGKYYSALLLASCFIASLLHPSARAYYRSAAPYLAIAVFLAVVAPHLGWGFQNGFPTIDYAVSKTHSPFLAILGRALVAVLTAIAFHLLALLVLWLAVGKRLPALIRASAAALTESQNRWLLALALGPFVLTVLAVLLANVRISAQFMIPIFFLLPVLALSSWDSAAIGRLNGIASRGVAAFLAFVLISAPIIAALSFGTGADTAIEPRRQVMSEALKLWQTETGAPLRLVAGTRSYSMATTFYAPSHPSEFSNFSFKDAPWVTPERIASEGILIVCVKTDAQCRGRAEQLTGGGLKPFERSFAIDFLGRSKPPTGLLIYVVAPVHTGPPKF